MKTGCFFGPPQKILSFSCFTMCGNAPFRFSVSGLHLAKRCGCRGQPRVLEPLALFLPLLQNYLQSFPLFQQRSSPLFCSPLSPTFPRSAPICKKPFLCQVRSSSYLATPWTLPPPCPDHAAVTGSPVSSRFFCSCHSKVHLQCPPGNPSCTTTWFPTGSCNKSLWSSTPSVLFFLGGATDKTSCFSGTPTKTASRLIGAVVLFSSGFFFPVTAVFPKSFPGIRRVCQ